MAKFFQHYDPLIFISLSFNILVKHLVFAFALGLASYSLFNLLLPYIVTGSYGALPDLIFVNFIRNAGTADVSWRFLGSIQLPCLRKLVYRRSTLVFYKL